MNKKKQKLGGTNKCVFVGLMISLGKVYWSLNDIYLEVKVVAVVGCQAAMNRERVYVVKHSASKLKYSD